MDRLSQLPDSVIFHIFWFLPLNLFVRTSVLSKRWKDLWTTTPFLNFTSSLMRFDHRKGSDTMSQFGNFVFRALTRWDGERVLKFKVESDDESGLNRDIDLWARFAKKYHVQDLFFHRDMDGVCWFGETDHEIHWVPQLLYSCSSLRELSIKFCYFRINENVQWDNLKRLTIDDGFGITEHVINQILSGSPRLEVFILSFVERGENLCIRSSSLKELSMFKYVCHGDDDPDWYTELRIWTPNLETLVIKGLPYNKCFLMDVSSLTHVTFESSGLHAHDDDDDFCHVSRVDGSLPKNHYLGDLLNQTLPTIQHVESVTLSSCCSEVLGAMIERCMNSPSPNVRSLQLKYKLKKYELGLGIIEIFPQSKKLLLGVRKEEEHCYGLERVRFDPECYPKFEANIPKPFVKELKIVEVTWIKGNNVFPFLEFLLINAAKLEKMVFKVKRITAPSHTPSNSLLLASQKLLGTSRASPDVQFIFCEC